MLNGRFLGLVAVFSVLLLFLLAGRFSLRWEDRGAAGSELAFAMVFRFPAPQVVADEGDQLGEAWPAAFSQALHAAFVGKYADSEVEKQVTPDSFLHRLPSLVDIDLKKAGNGHQNSTGPDKR